MTLRSFACLRVLRVSCAVLLACAAAPALSADPIFGRWLTDDGAAIVVTYKCGEKLCGRIERVLDPAAPQNDIYNPDKRLRSKPLVGVRILTGFVGSGSRWDDGRAYDPKVGRAYDAKLELLENGKLKVTGCVLLICRSRYWTRAK